MDRTAIPGDLHEGRWSACGRSAVGALLLGLASCAQPLPELQTPPVDEYRPLVLRFEPASGFAAGPGFAGTEVRVFIEGFPGAGPVEVWFGEIKAAAVARMDGDVVTRVPERAVKGTVTVMIADVEAESDREFVPLEEPLVVGVEPEVVYARPGPDDICPGDVDLELELELPLPLPLSACDDCAGSCLKISGRNLSADEDWSGVEVTLLHAGDDGGDVEIYPVEILDANSDWLLTCVPEGLWSAAERSFEIRVKTPASRDEGGRLPGFWIPGCPSVDGIDPPAAYERAVVSLFGDGLPEEPELARVWLVDEDHAHSGTVVSSTAQSMQIQIPAGVVAPEEIVRQLQLVVATPVGRARLKLPFLVMGPPLVTAVAPRRSFAANPEWPVERPPVVRLEGHGFDISSTAANVVTLVDSVGRKHWAMVVAVSPVALEVLMPEPTLTIGPVATGWAQFVVTTTAGKSALFAPPPAGVPADDQPLRRDQIYVNGPPSVREYLPDLATWGDVIGIVGGPFDVANPEANLVSWSDGVRGGLLPVVRATEERLLVTLVQPSACGGTVDGDAGGGGGADGGALPSTLVPACPITLQVETSAGRSEPGSSMTVLDPGARMPGLVQTRELQGAAELPERPATAVASKMAVYAWNNRSSGVTYWSPLLTAGQRNVPIGGAVEAVALTPYGDHLYAVRSMDDAHELVRATPDPDAPRLRYLPTGQVVSLDPRLATRRTLVMVAGQPRTLGPETTHRLALLSEVADGTGGAGCDGDRRLHIGTYREEEDIVQPRIEWCELEGFHVEDIWLTEDQAGFEHIVASVDLASGCNRYRRPEDVPAGIDGGSLDGGPGGGFTELTWACGTENPGASCLALIEVRCGARSPDAEVTPLIDGLTLAPESRIAVAPLGATATVVSSIGIGPAGREWGRMVDLNYGGPVACGEVMGVCEGVVEGQRFQPPAIEAPLFGVVLGAAMSDRDSIYAWTGQQAGTALERLLIGDRWAPPITNNTHWHGVFAERPMAVNGFGGLVFLPQQNGDSQLVQLRRPLGYQFQEFTFAPGTQASCDFSARMLVVPGSAQIVERGCGTLGDRPCALFLGAGALINAGDGCALYSGGTWVAEWSPNRLTPWCLDWSAPGAGKELRPLLHPEVLDQGVPLAIARWGERFCVVASSVDESGNERATLHCVDRATACMRPGLDEPQDVLTLALEHPFSRPGIRSLPQGELLLFDQLGPALAVVSDDGAGGLRQRAVQLEASGVASVLSRRDSPEIAVATPGRLWGVTPTPEQLLVREMLQGEALPTASMQLLELWTGPQTLLYGAEAPGPDATRYLWALDLETERVLGQLVALDDHSDAIAARHGAAQLLVGRQAPAGLSVLDLASGSLRSFASLASALPRASVESIWAATSGTVLLVVDSAGELFFVF